MSQSKAALQAMLDAEKARFQNIYGGEVVRYAAPEKPNKIQLGTSIPIHNLVEEEYQEYLRQVEAGEYKPDTDYQVRPGLQNAHRKARVVVDKGDGWDWLRT